MIAPLLLLIPKTTTTITSRPLSVAERRRSQAMLALAKRLVELGPLDRPRLCADTPMGLLCSATRAPDVDRAIAGAADIVVRGNAGLRCCQIACDVTVLPVDPSIRAATSAEFVGRVQAHIGTTLSAIDAALRDGDAALARRHLRDARGLAQLLEQPYGDQVAAGLRASRRAAHELVWAAKRGRGGPRDEDLADLRAALALPWTQPTMATAETAP